MCACVRARACVCVCVCVCACVRACTTRGRARRRARAQVCGIASYALANDAVAARAQGLPVVALDLAGQVAHSRLHGPSMRGLCAAYGRFISVVRPSHGRYTAAKVAVTQPLRGRHMAVTWPRTHSGCMARYTALSHVPVTRPSRGPSAVAALRLAQEVGQSNATHKEAFSLAHRKFMNKTVRGQTRPAP